jgi:RNA polymerase sigma-70 factor (ECF subfamily)
VTVRADRFEGSTSERAAPAFELLFQEHWPRVYALLYRLVGDRAEAEDLALEAFWRLYRRPPEASRLGGWLYRVASNLGFNALRARSRRIHYEEQAGFEILENGPHWDPAVELERLQEREIVRAILAQMKPRAAHLLILRHSGLSYAELAEALDVAPGSIGTLLARAEAEFAGRLKEMEEK